MPESLELMIPAGGYMPGLAYSPDGRLLVACTWREAHVIEAATMRILRVIRGHVRAVRDVAFSPNGASIATASDDGTACIWDVTAGRRRAAFAVDDRGVTAVAFSPDGMLLATGSQDHIARIWDTETGELRAALPERAGWVEAVAFSPDGRFLATAVMVIHETTEDGALDDEAAGTVDVWDAETWLLHATLAGHHGDVHSLAFEPDGLRIAGADGLAVQLWDAGNGEHLHTFGEHAAHIRGIAFAPDGRRIATASYDGTARIWNVATGELERALTIPASQRTQDREGNNWMDVAAFSPDGRVIATTSRDGILRTWNAATGAQRTVTGTQSQRVAVIGISPDGSRLATSLWDGTTRLWDLTAGVLERALPAAADGRRASAVSFSRGGNRGSHGGLVATATSQGFGRSVIRTWDTATGVQLAAFTVDSWFVRTIAFQPGGTLIAVSDTEGPAVLWDAVTGKQRVALEATGRGTGMMAFSPDGTRIAACHTGAVGIWEAATGRRLREISSSDRVTTAVGFSSDGEVCFTIAYNGTIRAFEARTGALLSQHSSALLPGQYPVFSPGSDRIATLPHHSHRNRSGQVLILDSPTGTVLLPVDDAAETDLAFSADGKFLAVISDNGAASLRDAATGRLMATFIPLPGDGYATVLPDGRYKLEGDPAGRFWWSAGLDRHDPGTPGLPGLSRLPADAPIR